ncbi:Alpha/Beta hydrolase protein [Desarmillaria tabescens]|uniref:Alpha/Beta hydrolase protein n=1 Tax=Armillaria tabescens TaxID=1929756 RepID=A0AA39JTA6_ARMTA|nr:Alpha/Beta hydrolase protein [Desarmillaria tabescens]KAK0448394.1 Alpha/Beta hydrolase protein [Desarmillaria tabescens]
MESSTLQVLFLFFLLQAFSFVLGLNIEDPFHWAHVSPSDKLEWVDCYIDFQCTRLKVPLNYSEPEGETIAIAIVQYPSSFQRNSSDYLGPILFNPGGPGGSGVDLLRTTGPIFSELFDSRFDIVSFDPRGVARSARVSFFDTDVERELWAYNVVEELGGKPEGVSMAWAKAAITGRLAAEHDTGILAHINTDHTARDMLKITQAYGYEKIQYWGFSYGTVLGAVFASIFPDNVGRIIIDGVVDADNYYATLWSNNLEDSDKALQAFFDGCFKAGPQNCPFYADSPKAISNRLDALYKNIRINPVPVALESSYGILDYPRLRMTIFISLYAPRTFYPILAQALADLESGNGALLFTMTMPLETFECSCDPSTTAFASVRDSPTAIMCNDGAPVPRSLKAAQDHYDEMTAAFDWGSLWAGIRISCSGWPELPKNHFQGPFIANTSHPLLLIGNTADPVTPLAAYVDPACGGFLISDSQFHRAKHMSKGFTGSVVLTQDSPGHCSLAAPSLCTQQYIRDYFFSGTLPDPDIVCPVIGDPFTKATSLKDDKQAVFSAEERRRLSVAQELTRSFGAARWSPLSIAI